MVLQVAPETIAAKVVQLRGQLPCLDFGYHSDIKGFRGFV